jgi:hypothetical protein
LAGGAGGPLGGRTEIVGALHLHTRHSNGTGDGRILAEAAAANRLDFVVVNDHDSLAVRDEGGEGWHGRVLVAVGVELTAVGNCHLLAHGSTSTAQRYALSAGEALDRVGAEGARVYAAHPHGRGLLGNRRTLEAWPHWDHPRLTGLELWNYLQDWAQSFRLWQPASYRLEAIAGRIQGPPQWLLDRWDREAARRPFPAICGSDNHAKRPPLARVTFFPHEALIGRLVCRVRLERPLPADGPEAVRALFAALAAGRSIVAREELASSEGLDFRVETPDGRALRPGDGAPFAAGSRAVLESPGEAELRIVAGGAIVASARGRRLEAPLGAAGGVRAEARLDGRAWAFTNHVRIGC